MNTVTPKKIHTPVLLEEVLHYLDIQEEDYVMDGTIGFGGHSQEISKRLSAAGKLIGFDQDQVAYTYAKEKFQHQPNIMVVNENFSHFKEALTRLGINHLTKILLDLGMSSYHIDESLRGFSYLKNETLDMRMDPKNNKLTAAIVLNTYPKADLEKIFTDYGEIFKPFHLIENIVEKRKTAPFSMTEDLITIIKKSFYFHNKRFLYLKTLSQVFQALRIEVNQELVVLDNFLEQLLTYLPAKSRVAVITFHSLEDRIVKKFCLKNALALKIIAKKAIKPKQKEINLNKRAKSAKLRVFEIRG